MSKLRFRVVETAFKKKPVAVAVPAERPSEYFAKYVFNKEKMFRYLPSKVYAKLTDVIDNGAPLDRSIADEVAAGMKKWAVEMGATHYTHWFHPLTEGTAEKHDAFVEHDGKGGMMEKVHQTILSSLDFDGHGSLLEVGCGSGALAVRAALTWPEAKITGLDYWGAMYNYSKALCEKNAASEGVGKQCGFVHGDANKLDFPDGSFDAVISNYVYHNIMGADKHALLLESLRVLKKGGVFVLHDNMKPQMYGDMNAFVEELRGMGFAEVQYVETAEKIFGSKQRAAMMMLGNSAMIVGRK